MVVLLTEDLNDPWAKFFDTIPFILAVLLAAVVKLLVLGQTLQ